MGRNGLLSADPGRMPARSPLDGRPARFRGPSAAPGLHAGRDQGHHRDPALGRGRRAATSARWSGGRRKSWTGRSTTSQRCAGGCAVSSGRPSREGAKPPSCALTSSWPNMTPNGGQYGRRDDVAPPGARCVEVELKKDEWNVRVELIRTGKRTRLQGRDLHSGAGGAEAAGAALARGEL